MMASKKIKGHGALPNPDIDRINELKELQKTIISHIESLQPLVATGRIDGTWLNYGELQIKQGFMSVVRALAVPEPF